MNMPWSRFPLCAVVCGLILHANAEIRTWSGANSVWSNPAAWLPAGPPAIGDEVHIDSGVIHLDIPVTIGNRLVWTGGHLHSGTLRIAEGATAELGGPGDKLVQNVALVNAGSLRIAAGRLGCLFTGYNQFTFLTNDVTGVFELVEAAQVVQLNPGGWPPAGLALVNDGLLRKTGNGAGALESMPLINRGRVEITGGALRWYGGGVANGRFLVADGASMTLPGGTYQLGGSVWEGPGSVRLGGSPAARLTVQGAFTAANFGFNGGTIDGDFEVAGAFEWTAGTLVNGRLRLGPGQHRILGPDAKELLNAQFANAGQLAFSGTSVGLRLTGYQQAIAVTNETNGVWTWSDGAALEQRNPGGWPPVLLQMVNFGTLRGTGDATNRVQDIPLNNHGLIEVTSGRWFQRGGGASTGRWNAAEPAVIEWNSGRYDLDGAVLDGPGHAVMNGPVTLVGKVTAAWLELESGNLNGQCTVADGFRWSGGQLIGMALELGPGKHAILGDHGQRMNSATLVNHGQLQLEDAVVALAFTGFNQSLLLTNAPEGECRLLGHSRLYQSNPGGWPPLGLVFVNDGTLIADGGETNSIEWIPLNNRSAIEVTSGCLRQTGGGTSPGKVALAPGTRFELNGAVYDLDGGEWSGPGAARIVASSRLLGMFRADNFGLESGDLDGAFDLTGGFHWTGGRLVNLRARLGLGTHVIEGGGDRTMIASTLANAGQLILGNTTLAAWITGFNQSVVITNEPGGVLELAGAARIEQRNPGGYPAVALGLENEGTLRATGPELKAITAVPFHNRGGCEFRGGIVQHTGGGISPGTFAIAANARFEFCAGLFDFTGSVWPGAGPAAVIGNATLIGDFSAANFRLEQGAVSGSFGVSGAWTWTGGALINAGLRLGAGTHSIEGPADKYLVNATLANAGHLTVDGCTLGLTLSGFNQSLVITNETGGLLDLFGPARIEQRNPSGWPPVRLVVGNAGTWRKIGPEQAVLASLPFLNSGRCEIPEGTLRIEGSMNLSADSLLVLAPNAAPALNVTGAATLGGVVAAIVPSGATLENGATFTPFTAGSLAGRFLNEVAEDSLLGAQFTNSYPGALLRWTVIRAAHERPRLGPAQLVEGTLRFSLPGLAGLTVVIESSTDLVHWLPELTTVVPSDDFTFSDSLVRFYGRRFFRVRIQP